MKLRIHVSLSKIECEWYDTDVLTFPKTIAFDGRTHEWIYYDVDKDPNTKIDYVLYFKEITNVSPLFGKSAPDLQKLIDVTHKKNIGFDTSGCSHDWKQYTGLSQTFDYCTKCNEKRR